MGRIQMKPNWERALREQVGPVVDEIGVRLQEALDQVSTDYSGRPLAEVKEALSAAWAGATPGGSITEPELTAASEVITRGGRLRLENGHLVADEPDTE